VVGVPVRGLLLDAGGVLIGPVGGRWSPRFDFESPADLPWIATLTNLPALVSPAR
jgi:hypothetical protein